LLADVLDAHGIDAERLRAARSTRISMASAHTLRPTAVDRAAAPRGRVTRMWPSERDRANWERMTNAAGGGESSDRREVDRLPIELRVEYRRLNSFFADYTKNISKGGTFIRTSKPLPPGTEFVFVLTIPRLSEPLRINGEVMWVTDPAIATDEKPAGMGIRFRYADDREREAVESVVERLVKEELGDHISERLLRASRNKR
jgi:type IV pilus assembly protein PilZ